MDEYQFTYRKKTSSILNEIKWKKIFLFNPGESFCYRNLIMELINNFSEIFLSAWNKGILGVDIFQILIGIEFF